MKDSIQSAIAVVGGYSILALLVMLATSVTATLFRLEIDPQTGAALEQPPVAFSVVLLILSLNAAVIAGYATATLARRKEVGHAAVLGSLVFFVGVVYQLWQTRASVREGAITDPLWFLLLLPALSLPAVIAGGVLRAQKKASSLQGRDDVSPGRSTNS